MYSTVKGHYMKLLTLSMHLRMSSVIKILEKNARPFVTSHIAEGAGQSEVAYEQSAGQ